MKTIQLNRGFVAIVDDSDYDDIAKNKWCVKAQGLSKYAVRHRNANDPDGPNLILMHRYITGATGKTQVDHVDGNGLNNSRSNLRLCKQSENLRNKLRMRRDNTSGYKGVSKKIGRCGWWAKIDVGGKQVWIGHYKTAEEAANAYDEAAIKYFGEFAAPNRAMLHNENRDDQP